MDSELGQREKRQCLEAERKLLQFTMQMFIYIKRELPGSKVHSVKLPSEKTAHRKKKKNQSKEILSCLEVGSQFSEPSSQQEWKSDCV